MSLTTICLIWYIIGIILNIIVFKHDNDYYRIKNIPMTLYLGMFGLCLLIPIIKALIEESIWWGKFINKKLF